MLGFIQTKASKEGLKQDSQLERQGLARWLRDLECFMQSLNRYHKQETPKKIALKVDTLRPK